MSERILKALIQLFAIIARVDGNDNNGDINGREIVKLFLKERLPLKLLDEYLLLFDNFLEIHQKVSTQKTKERKRTSVNSVKILRICTEINEELTQRQKVIVMITLLEFLNTHEQISEQEAEFINAVAETFNFDLEEFKLMKAFIFEEPNLLQESANILYISEDPYSRNEKNRYLIVDGLEGTIEVLRIPSVNLHFVKYSGDSNLNITGQALTENKHYVLNQGTSIRGSKISPIYYSDIISTFLSDKNGSKTSFKAAGITYKFNQGNFGLQKINIFEESGKLLGIMGASGSGKSTLLNVLNGTLSPAEGSVTINGFDIHKSADKIPGVIGYVAQDDLLIEELTVFQNLFYNTKLCFGENSDEEISEMVEAMLTSLGLSDTKDLKVGNPLDKTISGGQRKRLNIALELIREPSVLFVDEPTSGLSSRDSENIMDLLKELSLKGKLIFVVIHQPSSDIFKMFDKLIILDKGGFPIYYGNPVDSVIYFKKRASHVNSDESECIHCGNVNPEQIFDIIEAKVVDEYGNLTKERKVSPKEWNEQYETIIGSKLFPHKEQNEIPSGTIKIPNAFKQFQVFIQRDVLSKLSNTQYILINLLEAPVLALILSFFMKYFLKNSEDGAGYVFRENENLPAFLFISVIVALFIGLTVSSEEIIRDKKIRKRESFLNLSKSSYLFSKISIMFGISAIQMFLFVLIGNYILEIEGMTFVYWVILFSTCCFANMLGLNISDSFNSAKVIYIFIPILIIPQLLFSGILVKFDKLHPIFASQSAVPWIGNIMASRWAYEGLAVAQFKWNEYEEQFFELERRKKYANWKKDYWITELRNKANSISAHLEGDSLSSGAIKDLNLIRNEVSKENEFLSGLTFEKAAMLTPDAVNLEIIAELNAHLAQLNNHYKNVFLKADSEKEAKIYEMTQSPELNKAYLELLDRSKNDQLETFVTSRNDLSFIEEYKGNLIQKKDLIYLLPFKKGFFESHFYAPYKILFGKYIDTFYANVIVLWGMTVLLGICLFFGLFRKAVEFGESISGYLPNRHKKGEK